MRCPSGTSAKCFFAKHPWAGLSDDVHRVDVGENEPMLAIDDLDGLIDLVQAGVVEIHPWGSPADDLEQPDRLIFDLDPGEDVPWGAVIAAAREVRSRLEALGLKSFVKTSGGKGLHVVVPIAPAAGWDEAKAFTQSVAEAMARDAARPLRRDHGQARAARPHLRRLFPQRPRRHGGRRLFDARAAASLGVDAARPGTNCRKVCGPTISPSTICATGCEFLERDPWQGFFKLRQRMSARVTDEGVSG